MKKWKWVVSLLCALICMLGISMHAFAMVQQVSLSNHSGYEAFSNVFSPVPDVGNCYSAFIDTSDVPWEDFGHDYRTLWDSFLSSYLNNNSYRIYFTFSDYASRDPSGELFYFFSINVTPVSGFSSGIDFSSTNKKVQVRPSQLLSCSFRLDSDGVCRPYGKWGIQTLYGMPTGQTYLDNCSDLFSASNITYNYPIFSDLDALFFTDDLGHSFSIESTDFSVVPLLKIVYQYEDGTQAAQPVMRSLIAGDSYEITSPTIKNYTADRVVVSGIMPERDLTVHVLYRKDSSGSSSSSGKFPDVAAGVEWKDPLTWFDIAEGVEWKDPLTWFDIADGVEWKDPLTWFDIAEGVEWIDPFNYDWG